MSEPDDTDGDGHGMLTTLGDGIWDIVTGIPAPIRKNAIKAFAQLCTTAISYPTAMIEGAVAEKRAETRARVKLIETSADQIATLMQTNPEYVRAAANKFARKIIREQVNLDNISELAAANLKSEEPTTATDSAPDAQKISEDWLNVFENEAGPLSSDQMQRLFGKILAGEIRKPGSYSIKTLKLMAQLDNHAAILFRLLCSISVSWRLPDRNFIVDARVVSMGSAGANSLAPFGLPFEALNVLNEYGLIISDYNSYSDGRMSIVRDNRIAIRMTHQNALWALVPKSEPTDATGMKEVPIHGVAFSRAGKELLPIVDISPNEQYTDALRKFFDGQGLTMTKTQ